jgi:hypothetical protein
VAFTDGATPVFEAGGGTTWVKNRRPRVGLPAGTTRPG